jgi:HEAT repeat protein
MNRRVPTILAYYVLVVFAAGNSGYSQKPGALPGVAVPAPPAPATPGWEPDVPFEEQRLTKADIPSDLPRDLKKELAGTFDVSPKTRAACATAIGKRGAAAAAAVPFLMRLLCDNSVVDIPSHDPENRKRDFFERRVEMFAFDALTAIGKPAEEPCASALKRSSGEPCWALMRVLGRLQDPRAIEALAPMLEKRNQTTRLVAADSLAAINDPRAVSPLLRALGDKEPRVRAEVASLLGTRRDPRVVRALIAALDDKNDEIRRNAVKSLGKQRDRSAAPALVRTLRDKSDKSGIREWAADALGKVGDSSSRDALLEVLKDRAEPESLRSSAVESLGELGGHDAVVVALKDRHETVDLRCCAARGLGRSGNASNVPPLIAIAADSSDSGLVRGYAVDAVAALQAQEAIPFLRRIVKDTKGESGVRCCAAVCLVQLTDGKVDDIETVSALRGNHITEEPTFGHVIGRPERRGAAKQESLRSIAEHSKTENVRAAAKAALRTWQLTTDGLVPSSSRFR